MLISKSRRQSTAILTNILVLSKNEIFVSFWVKFSVPCSQNIQVITSLILLCGLLDAVSSWLLSSKWNHSILFQSCYFDHFKRKIILFLCFLGYTALLIFTKNENMGGLVKFRMFSSSKKFKLFELSHHPFWTFGTLWIDSGPLC